MFKNPTFSRAIGNALNGLYHFFLHEKNGQRQFAVAVLIIASAISYHISATEWLCILMCIGAVLCLEMINSCIEKLCDVVQEEYHPLIKIIKDVSAGAVLFASFISVITGCIIFLPKII